MCVFTSVYEYAHVCMCEKQFERECQCCTLLQVDGELLSEIS